LVSAAFVPVRVVSVIVLRQTRPDPRSVAGELGVITETTVRSGYPGLMAWQVGLFVVSVIVSGSVG
jgi:hypothetical protein